MQQIPTTIEQMHAKRGAIVSRLSSSEHRASVLTRDYGCYSPLAVELAVCDCDREPKINRIGKRFVVLCDKCGHRPTKPSTRRWAAALNWNIAQAHKLTYKEVIHFDLPFREPSASRVRLQSILKDLELKCELAALEYRLSLVDQAIKAPGAKYHDRLRAYKKWATLGLTLVERELNCGC